MRFLSSRHLVLGVLVFLTLGVNALVAYISIERLASNGRGVSLTVTVSDDIERVQELINDIDASERAFIATGQDSTLNPYRVAENAMTPALARLDNGSSDTQRALVVELRTKVRSYGDRVKNDIAMRRKRGVIPALAQANSQANAKSRQDVEELLNQMRGREQEILESRASDSGLDADNVIRTFTIATGVEIASLALIFYLLWRASRQNRELETAYRDLKHAEGMRDNLSAMLVHDLRTPLTTLLGPLHSLKSGLMGPLDATQRELVAISEQSGYRLLGLVNELLDISKMEAGEFPLHLEHVKIGELVQAALTGVRLIDEGKNARISTGLEHPEQDIEVDVHLIERILINLLGNALKFTPVTGSIILGSTQDSAGLRFYVRDSGRGIPAEYREKIFEKFGQVESRAQGQRFSTGLGLTFCKLAVEAHGGRIWLESEPGHGSTFWFSLPPHTLMSATSPKIEAAPELAGRSS